MYLYRKRLGSDPSAKPALPILFLAFEGYGRSSKSAGNSNVADGVEDLKAASAVVLRETGQKSFHLYGESGGALRAGVFAMAEPQRIRRLVLSAFTHRNVRRGQAERFHSVSIEVIISAEASKW